MMTPTCHIGSILLAQTTGLDIPEPILRWAETLTPPTYLALGAVGLFAFFIGWAIARAKARSAQQKTAAASGSEPNAELIWRHEKLVLLERQDQEKQTRIIGAIDDAFPAKDPSHAEIRMRLFRISETLRDIRQRVGSDLSRLNLLEERITSLKSEGAPRPEALDASLEIASAHARRLYLVRDQLRPVTTSFLELESNFSKSDLLTSDRSTFRDAVLANRNRLSELPSDWQVLTNEADRKIGELLAGEPAFDTIRNVLLIDGAVTASLTPMDDAGPRKDVDAILTLLDRDPTPPIRSENPFESVSSPSPYLSPPEPDSGFRAPTAPPAISNGSHEEQPPEPSNEFDEETESHPPQIIFCANDPNLWGKNIYRGANYRAREMESLPDWAEWISIRRMDTGEAVFAPASTIGFANHELHTSTGFNASLELFYGARHLGMFSESVPNDVETRFTYGGWGFGHRVTEEEDESESAQASGWAGQEISSDTVFEIALHQELPESTEDDQILRVGDAALAN